MSPVAEPADHALGRSHGGLSTKAHLAMEQRREPLATVLRPGQAADSPQFTTVLGRIRVPDAQLLGMAYWVRPGALFEFGRRHGEPFARLGVGDLAGGQAPLELSGDFGHALSRLCRRLLGDRTV
jgi:hypothetical protein